MYEPCYCGSFDCPSCGPLQGVPQRTHYALGSLSAEDIDILNEQAPSDEEAEINDRRMDEETTMHQPILPRDDDNQPMTFEGKRVVVLHSASGTYREWEVTIDRERYCIINDDGTWTLLRYDPVTRQWLERHQSVDTFLVLYRLILAA